MLPFLASAAELQPLMTVPGKLLLSEEFSGPALPADWQPGGQPESFSIVDGALHGVCAPGDHLWRLRLRPIPLCLDRE